MAFRTNKVPAIEERTVSGSSVSFNSAFALPLKACKVSFEGTQEGSGTTSPTNKRPLTYKSNVSLSDNGSTNIISLGGRNFYKFDLDVLNGILEPTMEIVTIDENSDVRLGGSFYIKSDATDFFVPFPQIYPQSSIGTHVASYALCDTLAHSSATIWITVGYPNSYGVNMAQFHCNIANDLLGITDYTQETASTALAKIKVWLADNPITCAIPIKETIQLSANELSSIIGNNTFSTDTGTLEITFADLQEKSASGAVATFNTALAMPLASCNIAVNAWQEGSGDPSPVNNRPIHGFSEVNLTANNVVHTIQLGQEVYGAEVDVVNGVAHVDRKLITLNGSENYTSATSYIKSDACDAYIVNTEIYPSKSYNNQPNNLFGDKLKLNRDVGIWANVGYPNQWLINAKTIHLNIANDLLGIVDYTQETIASVQTKIKNWVTNNNLTFTIPIEPFDIQLTPTQIETIIGNNTIFADTGDVDLTYKDLDIAKRGNFREVFKLPS